MNNSKYKIPYPKISYNSSNAIKTIKDFDYSSLLFYTLTVFFIIIIFMTIYYIYTDCLQKKSLIGFLFDFSFNPCVDSERPIDDPISEITKQKEVFHLSNQDYTYEQAKCKCVAYGGTLATKAQIIDAYNKGADWCSYGWSEGQQAFYPTQKCTWDQLQKSWKTRWDCGYPGVNGGFFANPMLKFGANCFGYKPEGALVKEKRPECKAPEYCELKSNYRASNILDTDEIAPFNDNRWNE